MKNNDWKKKNTDEGKSAAERGRELYAQMDYEGALEAFSEAVSGSTEHLLLNALDNRAATFEKLGRFKAGLRDAKRMMESMPTLSKGYLRCGKLLQLSGKTQLAMQIYERGLNKIKITSPDRGRMVMQAQYNKLKNAQTPTETRDPFRYMPPEVAIEVCRHLAMRDRVVCLAVSRGWKTLLEGRSELWTELDTTFCKRSMSLKSLKIHLRRSKYTLDFALITMRSNFDDVKMNFLTRTCKSLRELKIEGSGLIGSSLSESVKISEKLKILHVSGQTEASLGTIQSCLRTATEIESMTFLKAKGSATSLKDGAWFLSTNEHIKNLELRSDKRSLMDINGLIQATPNLESAVLPCWKILTNNFDLMPWTKLEYLDLTNCQITIFPKLPATLKHLILADNPLLAVANVTELVTLTVMPLLETFNCHATSLDAGTVKHLTFDAITNGHLKRLSLGGRVNALQDISADAEFPASEQVEELSIALLHLNDERALSIVDLYPNLRKLDVSGTNITGVAIKDFVKRGITSLKLDECSETSPDAVEWARGKGIEVSYNFPSRSGPPRFADSALARTA